MICLFAFRYVNAVDRGKVFMCFVKFSLLEYAAQEPTVSVAVSLTTQNSYISLFRSYNF